MSSAQKKKRKASEPTDLPPASSGKGSSRHPRGGPPAASTIPEADPIHVHSSVLYQPERSTCEIYLEHGSAALFEGRALLTVSAGALLLWGSVVKAGSAPVLVTADSRDAGMVYMQPQEDISGTPLVYNLKSRPELGVSFTLAPPPDFLADDVFFQVETFDGLKRFPYRIVQGAPDQLTAMPRSLVPTPWEDAAGWLATQAAPEAGLGRPPVILLCGAKGSGKSTFARLILNRLLSKCPEVLFLDTDVGQPEFTAPGMVSLARATAATFGPPQLRFGLPGPKMEKMQFVGDTSPEGHPVGYLAAVRSLVQWYYSGGASASAAPGAGGAAPHTLPLVVNTNGWVKGLGLDLLSDVIRTVCPTHLIRMVTDNPKNDPPGGAFWLGEGEGDDGPEAAAVLPVEMPIPSFASALGAGGVPPPSRRAAEVRSLLWLQYARMCCRSQASDADAAAAGTSAAEPPSRPAAAAGVSGRPATGVDAAAAGDPASRQASGPASGSGDVGSESSNWMATAGLLAARRPYVVPVSAVGVEFIFGAAGPPEPSVLYRGLNVALVGLCRARAEGPTEQDPPDCLGLGIVRSVDAHRGLLYILTDIPPGQLAHVGTLQVGRLEMPALLLQAEWGAAPYVSRNSVSAEGTGAGAVRPRNNLMRLAQSRGGGGA